MPPSVQHRRFCPHHRRRITALQSPAKVIDTVSPAVLDTATCAGPLFRSRADLSLLPAASPTSSVTAAPEHFSRASNFSTKPALNPAGLPSDTIDQSRRYLLLSLISLSISLCFEEEEKNEKSCWANTS
jgi:hypothetical protein